LLNDASKPQEVPVIALKRQKEYGSFKNWIDKHHALLKEEWGEII